MWEVDRVDWQKVRAGAPALHVPAAISALMSAKTEQDAEAAYWRIDNTVVVQGSLYEAARPATACLVIALSTVSRVARPWLLELLVQIGGGEVSPTEIAEGNGDLRTECLRELTHGLALYLEILESGRLDEKTLCVDLLGLCARENPELRERVSWYLNRFAAQDLAPSVRQLVSGWIAELSG